MLIVRKASITNFRGCAIAALDNLSGSVLVQGTNWQGKTSLLDAIRFALIGEVYDANGKRLPLAQLLGQRPAPTGINLALDFGSGIEAYLSTTITEGSTTMTISTEAFGGPTSVTGVKECRRWVWGKAGVEAQHAAFALNPQGYYLSSELDELLSNMYLDDLPAEKGIEYALQAKLDYKQRLEEAMVVFNLRPSRLTEWRQFGDKLYAERTAAGRQLRQLEAEMKALPEEKPPTPAKLGRSLRVEDIPGVRATLNTVASQRDKLNRKLGGLTLSRPTEAQVQAAEKLALACEAKEAPTREAEAAAQETYDQLETELRSKMTDITGLGVSIAEAELTIKERERAIEKILSTPQCPHCGQPITEEVRERLLKPQRDAAQVARERLMAAEKTHAAFLSDEARLKEQIVEARKALDAAKSKHAEANTEAIKARSTFNAIVQRAQEDPAESVEAIEEKLRELDRVELEATDALRILQNLEKRLDLEPRLQDAILQHKFLDWAVDAFRGSGSFYHEELAQHLKLFEEKANTVLRAWGLQLIIDLKDVGLVFYLQSGKQSHASCVPVAQASKAQRVLTQAALAISFGEGGVAIIDDIDSLDPKTKAHLLRQLRDTQRASSLWLSGAITGSNAPDWTRIKEALSPASIVLMDSGKAEQVEA